MQNSIVKELMNRYEWDYLVAYQEYITMRLHVSFGGCPLEQLSKHELEHDFIVDLI